MARAKNIDKGCTRLVKLTLTENEAATLLGITMRIGGDPNSSPRAHSDDIAAALLDAGISIPGHRISSVNRAIYFYSYDGSHSPIGF